eukprot:3381944-Pyramimonas_sp.AAC.1
MAEGRGMEEVWSRCCKTGPRTHGEVGWSHVGEITRSVLKKCGSTSALCLRMTRATCKSSGGAGCETAATLSRACL